MLEVLGEAEGRRRVSETSIGQVEQQKDEVVREVLTEGLSRPASVGGARLQSGHAVAGAFERFGVPGDGCGQLDQESYGGRQVRIQLWGREL